jgi:SAM-dependent methyltransferase
MEVNIYGRQLSPAEIEAKEHRNLVGGLWDEIGELQLNFLKDQGLQPQHRLVDVGCGALRGGVHFIRYLDPGCYYGIDINRSLIDAGRQELEEQHLAARGPNLLVDDNFAVNRFDVSFDFALAVSLFTHLPMNHIVRCLVEVRTALAPGGRFFASYFEAPACAHLQPLRHATGGIVTRYDADPFHHAFDELAWLASIAGLRAQRIGKWAHPRGHSMAMFFIE